MGRVFFPSPIQIINNWFVSWVFLISKNPRVQIDWLYAKSAQQKQSWAQLFVHSNVFWWGIDFECSSFAPPLVSFFSHQQRNQALQLHFLNLMTYKNCWRKLQFVIYSINGRKKHTHKLLVSKIFLKNPKSLWQSRFPLFFFPIFVIWKI